MAKGTCQVVTPDGLCTRRENASGLCAAHLWRRNELGDVVAHVRIGELLKRRRRRVDPSVLFWRQVTKTDAHWLWRGALNKGGYGTLQKLTYGHRLAHRFAWADLVGPIPAGLVLDHECRDRACVRPGDGHLRLVTLSRNSRENHAWNDPALRGH